MNALTAPEFPQARMRRLRLHAPLREMLRETRVSASDFIYPLFVRGGTSIKQPIPSMPGIHQFSVDSLAAEIEEVAGLGLPAVMLFGIPEKKDPVGEENWDASGLVQQATRLIKEIAPELIVITDVCLCEYTDHGHCGLLNNGDRPNLPDRYVLNDESLEVIAKVSISHAEAGADMVAPSGMLDGMVAAIRSALDTAQFEHVSILSYAVKFASSFYGPFRDAAESPPMFEDRKSHQMASANIREAIREVDLDIREGADILMVKPALPYLDVIRMVRERHPEMPLAAYNVSGEYAMLKAAASNRWLDERGVVLETLIGIKRAGADLILTYHAKEASRWLKSG